MIVLYNALVVRPGVFDGAATFSLNVVPALADALPDDVVVALVRQGENRLVSAGNLVVRPIDLPSSGWARVVYELVALRRAVRREGAEVVVAPSEMVFLRSPAEAVVVAQNLVYHRDGWRQAYQGATLRQRATSHVQAAYYRTLMPIAYARAARVAAVSETTARVLGERARLDPAKVRVIYEGSDSRLLPPPSGDRKREPRILVVSTLAPYKGLERALDVFARVHRERPELELDLVGGSWRGFRMLLSARAAVLGVSNGVRFVDAVDGKALADLYESSVLLLHLSECESFGLPVAEAMRYGLPVVTSGSSSLAEVTGDAAVELTGDLDGAARQLLGLLGNEGALRDLAERGRRRAAELTWSDVGHRLAAVVREAADVRRVPVDT